MSKVAVLTERNILKEVITVPDDEARLDASKRWVPLSPASDLHHKCGSMYYDWGNGCFFDVNYHPQQDSSENEELIDTILESIVDVYKQIEKPPHEKIDRIIKRRQRA